MAEQLLLCSSNTNDEERLSCFDKVAVRLATSGENSSKAENTLPDNLGGGKFDKGSDKQHKSRGVVESCKKSHDGGWFLIFENGQIWKQVHLDRRRYNYKDCSFEVLVTKDGFGYKMLIPEKSKEARVKRHR